jgi:CRISPR/Cas system-associated exonuclease Cas4 (RecB family)
MATPPTTAELLLEWDRRRPRSQQREFGMSELGGCRRRAGYRLAGVEPTNAGSSVQAVMGTAIHDAVAAVLAETAAPDDLVEHEVRFAGVLGHLDRYEAAAARLIDVKTTSSRWLAKLKAAGQPTTPHLWQVHAYAAALIAEGRPVRELAIDYLARDTGEQWRWTGRFDPLVVREALEWVRTVRETELEFLPRDYEPDGPFCQHCPFFRTCWDGGVPGRDPRSVLYVEDPDAAGWVAKLERARADLADAKRREAEAKGALDALRTIDGPDAEIIDVGPDAGRAVRFVVSDVKRLDSDAVRAEYRKAGAEPPMKPSRSVRVELVARPERPAEAEVVAS